MFAKHSIRECGLPFRPTLKTRDEMSDEAIQDKLARSEDDLAHGRLHAQGDVDLRMDERFQHGRATAV